MTPLFGNRDSLREISITIYGDERKSLCERWDYTGVLFIPTPALPCFHAKLQNCRDRIGFYNEMKFSSLNPSGRGAKVEVAKLWVSHVIEEAKGDRDLFIKILGVDKENIDYAAFGGEATGRGTYANIYNRLFRSQLIGGIKYYFGEYDRVVVDDVIHHREGNLQNHEYFDWHSITRADREIENVSFASDTIRFVSSDPGSEDAHDIHTELVQFTDIVLGSVSHCVECHNERNNGQHRVAEVILPLVERMSLRPKNAQSSYRYHRRYGLSFFPKPRSQSLPGGATSNAIYTRRRMRLREYLSGQGDLF